MIRRLLCWLTVLSAPLSAGSVSQVAVPAVPGIRADGSILLPNQWSLRPSGRQVPLGDFPVNLAVHPSGKYVVALHSGDSTHELISVALPEGRVIARAVIPESFYGLAFSPDGTRLYASGAGAEVLHELSFDSGHFGADHEITLRDAAERGVPAGFAISADGRRLYAADVYGQDVLVADLEAHRSLSLFPLLPGMPMIDLSQTQVSSQPSLAAAEKRKAAKKDELPGDAPFPYACALDERMERLYVSLWGGSAIAVLNSKTGAEIARWKTEEHPCELLLTHDGHRLYVANAARNSVTVLDTASGAALETLSAAMEAETRLGSTPNSLALTPDEQLLFVANAGNNNVAVFDVANAGHDRSLGFIPVGWYPTSVRVTPNGKQLLVANGKGITSRSNRHGPQPGRELPDSGREYIGSLMQGTLSLIPIPEKREEFLEKLKEYTARAY